MNSSKTSLFIQIILLLACLIFLGLWQHAIIQNADNKAIAAAKTVFHNPTVKPIAIFKDQQGNTHVEIPANANQVTKAVLKDTAATNGTLIDSAVKSMNIKPGQLDELTTENLILKFENYQLKAARDTPGNHVFNYSDDHLNLSYNAQTNTANLAYHVRLMIGKFTPGSWLPFTTKPPLLDFSTDDPRATIGNVQHLSAIIPTPTVGFAADIKATYIPDSRQLVPSIGANLRLGRWHIEDRAYYDTKLKQAPGVSYDLLKF